MLTKARLKPSTKESRESRDLYTIISVQSTMNTALLKDSEKILKRWAEHYSKLLNSSNPVDRSAIEELPQLPPVFEMDELPILREVKTAVESLKCGNAPGSD